MTQKKYKILIVEDHPIVTLGITSLINSEKNLELMASAKNALEALDILSKKLPNLVIVDISLAGSTMDGLTLTKKIRSEYVDLPVLVLSIYNEQQYAERALKAGANGFVMKEEATDNLINAINQVLNGRIYLSHSINDLLLKKFLNNPKTDDVSEILTDRELEIFSMIGKGKDTVEIARELNLSSKTVNTHRLNIKKKLAIGGQGELLKKAYEWSHNN
jgi:DNA-binding NarL/FixJ family response regulator